MTIQELIVELTRIGKQEGFGTQVVVPGGMTGLTFPQLEMIQVGHDQFGMHRYWTEGHEIKGVLVIQMGEGR